MTRKDKTLVPKSKKELEKLKEESAEELAVSNQNYFTDTEDFKKGDAEKLDMSNQNPKSKKNFFVGDKMTKKTVKSYENKMK